MDTKLNIKAKAIKIFRIKCRILSLQPTEGRDFLGYKEKQSQKRKNQYIRLYQNSTYQPHQNTI